MRGCIQATTKGWLALYVFCVDFHSGQWSRGYRLSCRVRNKLSRRGIDTTYLDYNAVRRTAAYKQLAERAGELGV